MSSLKRTRMLLLRQTSAVHHRNDLRHLATFTLAHSCTHFLCRGKASINEGYLKIPVPSVGGVRLTVNLQPRTMFIRLTNGLAVTCQGALLRAPFPFTQQRKVI
jgi:hypothetical protein